MSERAYDRGGQAGAAVQHLRRGRQLPDIQLPTTAGRSVSLARLPGRSIVYCYPWTGRPGLPNPPGWDDIEGAHGSTPETLGFCDLYPGFRQVAAELFGLSVQSSAYQREMVERLRVPFEIISDSDFRLQRALSLPTFEAGGAVYLRRLTLCIKDGRIERVYYPVRSPAAHAREVCAWLGMIDPTH
jgi:peroxiredoxin